MWDKGESRTGKYLILNRDYDFLAKAIYNAREL
jgi:hypothetical protein